MKKETNDNIFSEGQIVYAKSNPGVKLIVRRYTGRIYYCMTKEDPSVKGLVFFERELTSDPGNEFLRTLNQVLL